MITVLSIELGVKSKEERLKWKFEKMIKDSAILLTQ